MQNDDLLILGIGISLKKNDGLLRFEHFCKTHDLNYQIVGEGKEWRGGNLSVEAGGGQKINELIACLENLSDNKLLVICDTFDVIPLAGYQEIVDKFNMICGENNILVASEKICWPDAKLASSYPQVNTKYKYLNSGTFIGYRNVIYDILKDSNISDTDDDQLLLTNKFLSGERIILDYKCELFQAMYKCDEDLIVHKNRVFNKYTNTYPVFIHGNGPAKFFLNSVENYLFSNTINHSYTCKKINSLKFEPKVFIALYIDSNNISNLKLFMSHVSNINYKNKEIYLYDKSNNEQIEKLFKLTYPNFKKGVLSYCFDDFKQSDCEYYFLLEQNCLITNKNILHELIPMCNDYHRVLSPMLRNLSNTSSTNFWGKLTSGGYYERSNDYLDIANYNLRGLWNVPYVYGAILMHKSIITDWDLSFDKYNGDRDMNLCFNLRKHTIFIYSININEYGHLA
ncbi:putative procollagen-lysine2-oxoglutarate dioxygenase [Cotonvirus japonicus]|uniref:Procollagen-lysine2-oxoglutarate dioxygenase n=1 Tax=Cotonvirus japonicus TaxID=2811091 RepID=A0ABM7NRU1_9VIRU|nr:putative procollagen-lysine2-oxoglutarate dioxygenase [Cotonvirus japonicus]BCS82883.1 putative procollagen-lysine2-oxoglutarate dioxygenase [Cotonvirus japonicus]